MENRFPAEDEARNYLFQVDLRDGGKKQLDAIPHSTVDQTRLAHEPHL